MMISPYVLLLKKNLLLLGRSIALLGCASIVVWRTYPLQEVSKPLAECKSQHRSKLDESCKMNLPLIKKADYQSYLSNQKVQVIYSDIWWWSYDNGRDREGGGAPSTDIATSEWTPVYAIAWGKVIFAGEEKWYGKSITIEHTLEDGKKIRSSYSHLNTIWVKKGEIVKEWAQIGEVGKTGFTIGQYGNHLDFALTTTKQKSYPYAYRDCPQGYMKAVQEWVCRDLLIKNTVDPILFLELWWDLTKTIKLWKASITTTKATKKLLARSNTDTMPKKALDIAKIATINQKIYQIKKDSLTIDIVDMKREDNESIAYKGKAYVTIVIKKNGKPYDGYLTQELSLSSKHKIVWIGWWVIDYVKGWEKTVILYWDKKWDDVISIKLGDEIVGVHYTKVS